MKHILRLCVSVPVNESISTQPCTYIKLQFSYITLKAFSDNLNVGHCETVFSPSRTLSYNFEIPTSTIQLIIFVNLQERKKEGWFCRKESQKFLRVSSFFIRRFLDDFSKIIFNIVANRPYDFKVQVIFAQCEIRYSVISNCHQSSNSVNYRVILSVN